MAAKNQSRFGTTPSLTDITDIKFARRITFRLKSEKWTFRIAARRLCTLLKNSLGAETFSPSNVPKNVIQAKAKEKQAEFYGNQYKSGLSQKSDEVQMRTDEELSKLAGVSRDTIRKAEKIIVEGNDEQKERARTGGKGNTVNAIFNEIVNAGENSRICTKCGKELPIKDFDGPRKICRRCRSINREFKDVKGNKIPVSKEINQLFKEHGDRVFDAITSGDVPEYTIENFVEELTALAVSFQGSVEACFLDHPEFDVFENKQKIIAALSAAEAAIKKIKEFG